MTVRPRSAPRDAVEQEDGDADAALIGADKIARAAAQWQILLADSMHQNIL
jgi:hypothetical protein